MPAPAGALAPNKRLTGGVSDWYTEADEPPAARRTRGHLKEGGSSLQSFAMIFDTEDQLRQGARRLVTKYGVTGEIETRPLREGKWLLRVSSEKDLRDSTLEKLCGQRVDADSLDLREAGT